MKNEMLYKEKIKECASQIIKAEGVRAVTVAKVVKACKISKSTFYKFFSSSQDLIDSLKEESEEEETFFTTRQVIIQKAVAAFSKQAFHEIDMDTIAKEVGLKRTSLYRYFANKEEMLEVFFRQELANRKQFNESMKSISFEPASYIKRLLDYGVSFSGNSYNNLMLRNLMYCSGMNRSIEQIWDEMYDCTLEIIEEYFRRGKKEGFFRVDLETGTISQLILSCWFGVSITKPEQYDRLGNQLIEMLILPMVNRGSGPNLSSS